jgi:hypothetical protein
VAVIHRGVGHYIEQGDRALQPFTDDEKMKVRESISYWEGKSLYDKWWAIIDNKSPALEGGGILRDIFYDNTIQRLGYKRRHYQD